MSASNINTQNGLLVEFIYYGIKNNLKTMENSTDSIENKIFKKAISNIIASLEESKSNQPLNITAFDILNKETPKTYEKFIKKTIKISLKALDINKDQKAELKHVLKDSLLDTTLCKHALDRMLMSKRALEMLLGHACPEFYNLSKTGVDFIIKFTAAQGLSKQFILMQRKPMQGDSEYSVHSLYKTSPSGERKTLKRTLTDRLSNDIKMAWEGLSKVDKNLFLKMGLKQSDIDNIGDTVKQVRKKELEKTLAKVQQDIEYLDLHQDEPKHKKECHEVKISLRGSLQFLYDYASRESGKQFYHEHRKTVDKLFSKAAVHDIEIEKNRGVFNL